MYWVLDWLLLHNQVNIKEEEAHINSENVQNVVWYKEKSILHLQELCLPNHLQLLPLLKLLLMPLFLLKGSVITIRVEFVANVNRLLLQSVMIVAMLENVSEQACFRANHHWQLALRLTIIRKLQGQHPGYHHQQV
jgi:hypothetical protein